MYRFYNANPYGNRVFDCAVRSLSTATGMTWEEAYQELSDNGKRLGLMMDSVESIEDYLDRHFDRQCHYAKTLEEFIEEFPYGTYIVSMNGHLTCVLDGGINVDTFNPSRRIIRCSWYVEE